MLKPKGLGQDTLIGLSCGGAESISIYAARRSHFHFHFHSHQPWPWPFISAVPTVWRMHL